MSKTVLNNVKGQAIAPVFHLQQAATQPACTATLSPDLNIVNMASFYTALVPVQKATGKNYFKAFIVMLAALLLLNVQGWGQSGNSGFESNSTTGWTNDGSGTVGVQNTTVRTGSYAGSYTTSSSSNQRWRNDGNSISVPNNSYVHFIAWVNPNAANTISAGINLNGGNSGGTGASRTQNAWNQISFNRQNTTGSAVTAWGYINTSNGVSGTVINRIDDGIIYVSTSSTTDLTKPSTATSFTNGVINAISVSFSWSNGSDAATGIQNTIILRTTNLSAATPVMNDQGVYSTAGGVNGPNTVSTDWTVISTSVASATTAYTDNTVTAGTSYKYAVIHRDLAYNYSTALVSGTIAVPATTIDYANLQFPQNATILQGGSVNVYGQVYTLGVTEAAGANAQISAWIGYSSTNENPNAASFTWVPASYNVQSGNNDEYTAAIGSSLAPGTYYYASRFQRNGGAYYYGGYNGGFWNGTSNVNGVLTVNAVTYTISSSAGSGGTISPNGSTTVNQGNSQTYTITPNSGFVIGSVIVDGSSVGTVGTYTFSNVTANHTISATFLPTTIDYANLQFPGSVTITRGNNIDVYAQVYKAGITEAAGAGSGISAWIGYSSTNSDPSLGGFTWVPASFNSQVGNNDEFKATFGSALAAGTYYYASRFQLNGGAYYYGGFNGGFWNGTSNVNGVLTINPVTYTITASAGAGGSISPNGSTTINENTNQAYTITANSGFIIKDVLVDGSSVGAVGTYTFSNVTANHTIAASFAATTIDYANLQFPGSQTISQGNSLNVYAQVYTAGVTEAAGANSEISAWIGYSSINENPNAASFTWVPASYNVQSGNNDEYTAAIGSSLAPGTYYYASRFQRNGGPYYYGGFNGGFWNGTTNVNGTLTVTPTGYTITSSAGAGGSISPNGSTIVGLGNNQTYTITPNSGFVVGDVLVDGSSVGAVGTYTFTNVTAAHTISASFLSTTIDYANLQFPGSVTITRGNNIDVYAQVYKAGITEAAGAGSGISAWIGYSSTNTNPSLGGFTWVPASFNTQVGNNDEFKATFGSALAAGTYYYASRFQLNGGAYYYGGFNGGFWNGTSNVNGVLTINPVTYTITASAGTGGSISPSGAVTVNENTNQLFTITANTGYAINDVLVDGLSVGAVGTYTFSNVTANHTISASFKKVVIDYANLQFPPSATINTGSNMTAYARVYVAGVTDAANGQAPGITAWIGYSSSNTNPSGAGWTWVPATFNVETDGNNNDEYQASFGSTLAAGTYYYASRFQVNGGSYFYGGYPNGFWNGTSQNSGVLTINCVTPAAPVITPSGATTFCTGGSVTLTSSSATGNTWSTGVTTQSITVNTSGTYTVAYTDGFGCTSAPSTGVTVTVNPIPAKPTITAGGPTTFCSGGSVTLTSSAATGNNWSTGATTQSINVTSSGSYTVSVTLNGCTSPTSDATSVTVNSFSSGVTVFTESMGTISGTTAISVQEAANGFDNDAYTMSGTGDLRNTTPSSGYTGASGNANVFLTSTAGTNFQIAGVNTTGLTNLQLSFGVIKSTTASNGSELVLEVSTDGTNYSPVTFTALPTGTGTAVWALTNSTGSIPSAGNLRIRFRNTSSTVTFRIDDVKLTGSSATVQITKADICGGKATLTSSSGSSYSWSNGASTQSTTVSANGTYTVTVTDANGCTASASIAVTVIPALTVSATQNAAISCNGGTTSVTVTPSGGTAPYNITGSNTTNLAAGTYNYTVTDASGCTATTSIVISQPAAITFAAPVVTNVSCFGGNNGKIVTSASGGTGAISYSISPNVGTQSPSGTFNNLTAQTYTLTATDASGCTATSSVTVTQPTQLVASETHSNVLCKGGNTGSATISATGGTAPYTGTGLQSGLIAGSYTYTVTDANGCTATVAVSITEPAILSLSTTQTDITCNGGTNGAINLTATGGTQGEVLTITQNFDGLASSGLSNSWVDGTTINNFYSFNSGAAASFSSYAADNGSSAAGGLFSYGTTTDRALGLMATNGTSTILGALKVTNTKPHAMTSVAVQYTGEQWRDANTVAQTLAFEYQINASGINAASGWTAVSALTFTSPKNTQSGLLDGNLAANRTTLSATIPVTLLPGQTIWLRWKDVNDANSDHGLAIDDLTVTLKGNTTNNSYNYAWTGTGVNATAEDQSGLTAGTYNVTVTDANGCTATTSVTLTVTDNTPPVITATGTTLTLGCNPSAADINAALGSATATDNCTVGTPVAVDGDVTVNGCQRSQTRTWTVSDNNGNAATAVSRTVTWTVVTAPVLTNIPVGSDLGCNPSVLPSCSASVTASNECGSVPVTCAAGTIAVNGCLRTQLFTYTATDVCSGLSSSATVTYTWTVVTAPVLSGVPTGGALGCNPTPPVCAAVTASNECGPVSVSCTPGTININGCNRSQDFTYTATACGLTTTKVVSYSWNVVTAPVLSGVPTGGNLGINPTRPACDNNVTASNECGAVPVTCNPGPVNSNGCGRTQLFTYTATDACSGLSSSAQVTYSWTEDNTPPDIVCSGPVTKYIISATDCSIAKGLLPAPSVTDICGIASITNDAPARFPLGQTVVTWTATDIAGNSATCTQLVTVIDDAPPLLTIGTIASCYKTVAEAEDAAIAATSATDNCGGVITKTASTNGTCNAEITVTVSDQYNNSNSFTYNTRIDDTAPVITTTATSGDLGCNPTVTAPVFTGTDNCEGTITPVVTTTGASNVGCAYTQTWNANYTDGCGNAATQVSITYTWTVDTQAPTVTKGTIAEWYPTVSAAEAAAIAATSSSDNCMGALTTTASTVGDCSAVITVTVTDGCGNSSSVQYNTGIDNTPPTAVCKNIVINLSAAGTATITAADIDGGSSDGCGAPVTLGASNTSFDCSNLGDNTVTLTVTDAGGNTSTCSATVTVKDVTPPTAVCKNITINLGAAGAATTITAADIDGGSSDGCGAAVTLGASKTSFDCSNLGNNTVILTVTDASGNTATCSATVTVKDVTPPTAVCKNITINLSAAGTASITAADIDGGSSDGCGAAVMLDASQTSFDCSNLGANTVTLTVKDASGNTSTCSATVTVKDVTPPTAVCKNIIVNLSAAGTATITAADIDGGSSDGCGATVILGASKTSFDCSNLGDNTVILTVTDASGNTSTCSATVTVKDVTPPTAVCKNITINLSAAGTASITAADIDGGSSDGCGAAVTLGASKTSFDCSNLGDNTVILTVTDASGNAATCSATVTVKDVTPPTAVCKNITINLSDAGTASITAADIDGGSSDGCGAAVTLGASKTSFDCSNLGGNTVTLTVTDASGNTASCSATVTVKDVTPPTAVCKNITVNLSAAGTATINAADIDGGSSDGCGAPVTLGASKTSFDCNDLGDNTVTLTVTDASGNAATCSATVTVKDVTPPTAVCKNITVNLSAAGVATITAADIDGGSSDGCGAAVTLSASKTTFACGDLGANTVILTVKDASGNTSTCSATVTVKDVTPPTAVCKNITVNLSAAGTATINAADIDGGSSDGCGAPVTLGASKTSFTCSNLGNNTVILTVTDVSGNTATCSATVTVKDVTPPTAVCKNITVNLSAAGAASIAAIDIDGGSSDACGISTRTAFPNTFTCANVGLNTVILTVTDASGNNSTCTATVTVKDVTAPTITCPSPVITTNDPSVCGRVVTGLAPVVSDVCGIASVKYTISGATTGSGVNDASGTNFKLGVSTVTYLVTDVNGNTNNCSFTVTVNPAPVVTNLYIESLPTTTAFQYSDRIKFTASIKSTASPVVTLNMGTIPCGPKAADAANFYIGTQLMGTASFTPSGDSLVATLTVPMLEASFGATVMDPNVNPKTASATLVSPNTVNYTGVVNPASKQFNMAKEDARIYYTGALFASTSGSSTSTATVTLSATVRDITAETGDPAYDAYAGDIRNAKVFFKVVEANNTVYGPFSPGLVNVADLKTGTVTTNVTLNIGNADAAQFTVLMWVDGYYTRNSPEDAAIVTVAKPLNDFITGGGYVILSNSAGKKAGNIGSKNNFGFNVKWNKSNTNLQGNINTIIRRTEGGIVRVYQVKGNSMTSLSVSAATTSTPGTAIFNGKANIQDITDPNNPLPVDGNASLQVTMTDMGEPGINDRIAITVWDKSGGLWFANNWDGIKTNEQKLDGGNLKVQSSSNYVAGTIPTSITLTSSVNSSTVGNPVTFRAVINETNAATPTGTVSFYDGSTLLVKVNVTTVSGVTSATLITSSLSEGTHDITAYYGGDSKFASSTGTLTQNVLPSLGTISKINKTIDASPANNNTEGKLLFEPLIGPNPSDNVFKLMVKASSPEQINVTVVDVMGRQVKQLVTTPYQAITFGNEFKKGIYFLKVVQGKNHRTIKLFKL